MNPTSKSKPQLRALELFEDIERNGRDIVIAYRARPFLRLPGVEDPRGAVGLLRSRTVRYEPQSPSARTNEKG